MTSSKDEKDVGVLVHTQSRQSHHSNTYHPDDDLKRDVPATTEPVHLERRFSFLACLGMAFIMLNSWTGMCVSSVAGPLFTHWVGVVSINRPKGFTGHGSSGHSDTGTNGGSVSVVYGCLVSAVGAISTGLSLAELCHVYPVSGGQYDWTYLIAPPRHRVGLSFTVGWLACAGWITFTAVSAAFCGTFVNSFVAQWQPDFEWKNWQTFLVYVAFTTGPFLLNTFAVWALPAVEKVGFYWGVSGILVVSITLLACASPEFQSGTAVFATFTNVTGWPDGVAFFLGLLQSTLGLAGYDAITHMMEEMPAPSRNGPKVLIMAIALGASTGWIFLIILLLCMRNIDEAISSPAGPLIAIYEQATNSRVGATCLGMFNFMCMVFMTQGIMTIASRMVFTFARDRGIGFLSPHLAPVHPTLKVPVWSIVFVTACVYALGLIYLGSSVAFNAIASAGLSLVQMSYWVPILIVLIRGDAVFEDQPRDWSLGKWRRPLNFVSLCFLSITFVFFAFPPALPVTGSSMNYEVVVLGIVLIFSLITWFTDGRKKFYGPSEVDKRLAEGRHM